MNLRNLPLTDHLPGIYEDAPVGGYALAAIKIHSFRPIHSISVVLGGKSISPSCPALEMAKGEPMMMASDDCTFVSSLSLPI